MGGNGEREKEKRGLYRGDTRSVRSQGTPKGSSPWRTPRCSWVLAARHPLRFYERGALYHTLVTCTFAPWRVSRDEEIWAGLRENGVIIYEGGKKEGVNQNGARSLRPAEGRRGKERAGRRLRGTRTCYLRAAGSIRFDSPRRTVRRGITCIDRPAGPHRGPSNLCRKLPVGFGFRFECRRTQSRGRRRTTMTRFRRTERSSIVIKQGV